MQNKNQLNNKPDEAKRDYKLITNYKQELSIMLNHSYNKTIEDNMHYDYELDHPNPKWQKWQVSENILKTETNRNCCVA